MNHYFQLDQLYQILGDRCACCGTQRRLTIDHRRPAEMTLEGGYYMRPRRKRVVTLKMIRQNPAVYQRLCFDCNRWKNDGPVCPCKFWDQQDSEWRSYLRKPFVLQDGQESSE